jgi:hypothetical protein
MDSFTGLGTAHDVEADVVTDAPPGPSRPASRATPTSSISRAGTHLTITRHDQRARRSERDGRRYPPSVHVGAMLCSNKIFIFSKSKDTA